MIIEIIIACALGSMLHFTYDWSKHNKVVGLFSAVNESTWEHIKMGLSSYIMCSVVDAFFLASNPNYFIAKFISLLVLMAIIPIIFYTYTSIVKRYILAIDISSFLIAVTSSVLVFYKILSLEPFSYPILYLGGLGTFCVFGFYMVLTLMPIKNFLFKDPITNKYGLKGHGHE